MKKIVYAIMVAVLGMGVVHGKEMKSVKKTPEQIAEAARKKIAHEVSKREAIAQRAKTISRVKALQRRAQAIARQQRQKHAEAVRRHKIQVAAARRRAHKKEIIDKAQSNLKAAKKDLKTVERVISDFKAGKSSSVELSNAMRILVDVQREAENAEKQFGQEARETIVQAIKLRKAVGTLEEQSKKVKKPMTGKSIITAAEPIASQGIDKGELQSSIVFPAF